MKSWHVLSLWYSSIAFGMAGAQSMPNSTPDTLPIYAEVDLQVASLHGSFSNQCIVLTLTADILKLDFRGNIRFKYSNQYFGTPQIVYSANPLQVVLFYPSFQTVVILDQSLNELKRVRLTDYKVPYVSTIGYTAEHEIWYYDDQSLKFKKINKNGAVIVESPIAAIPISSKDVRSIRVRRNEILVQYDTARYLRMNAFGRVLQTFECNGDLFSYEDLEYKFFDSTRQQVLSYFPKSNQISERSPLPTSRVLKQILYLKDGLVGLIQDHRLVFFGLTP